MCFIINKCFSPNENMGFEEVHFENMGFVKRLIFHSPRLTSQIK